MIAATHELAIEIGAVPIVVRTGSADFAHMLEDRYGAFVSPETTNPAFVLEVELEEQGSGIRDSGLGVRSPEFGVRSPESGRVRGPESEVPSPKSGREPGFGDADAELSVRWVGGLWVLERGDFRAELDPVRRCGWVRQTANPYSIDGVLRILHSLLLAREGGFLIHAASAARNGRAFVFAGASGAGKTTISRLAPPDVRLLTDEISYVRAVRSPESGVGSQEKQVRSSESGVRSQERSEFGNLKFEIGNRKLEIGNREPLTRSPESGAIGNRKSKIENPEPLTPSSESEAIENRKSKIENPEPLTPNPESLTPAFQAFGTPFAGELARVGENVRAPLAAVYLLAQGPENRFEAVSEAAAARELLRHVLFFAQDDELVGMVFETICDFVRRVPVRRLVFAPDRRVWEMIS